MPRWTIREDNFLRENYHKLKKKELIQNLNRHTASAINIRASKLQLFKIKNEYCKSNLSILLNESIETYYWIGFLMADGHFSKSNRLTLVLSIKDKNHLIKFANYIKCQIREYYNKVKVNPQDKYHISQIKNKFKISNKKTYFPCDITNIKDTNLFLAWLIGYIDGDGSITTNKKRHDYHIQFRIHKSWTIILEDIKNRLSNIFRHKFCDVRISKDGYSMWSISNFSIVKKIKQLAIELNVPYLERKWDKINLNYKTRYEKTKFYKEFISNNLDKRVTDLAKILKISISAASSIKKSLYNTSNI